MEKEFKRVVKDVETERIRQDQKWGVQHHHPMEWLVILMEELGEASKEMVDYNFGYNLKGSSEANASRQAQRKANYRTEMVQVAAVAMSMIEDFDRNPI